MHFMIRSYLSNWREWTWEDWLATPQIVFLDARRWLVQKLLDGPLGNAILSEIGFRQALAHARAIGSECYCVYHRCDSKDCPADGSHDD